MAGRLDGRMNGWEFGSLSCLKELLNTFQKQTKKLIAFFEQILEI
jgi:hypothetical protein